jgi:hypothetical protein
LFLLANALVKLNKILIETGGRISESDGVSKPALGRGLGSLMGGPKPPEPANPAGSAQPLPEAVPGSVIGRGIGTLLRGVAQDESPVETISTEATVETPAAPALLHGVPRWSFFAGDILLVGFAAIIAFNTSAPLDLPRVLFCAVATGLGAWLGIQPFLADHRARQQPASVADLPAWLMADYRMPDGEPARLLIHAHPPIFVARVIRDEAGKPGFTPVGVEGTSALSSGETTRLLREAGDFYRRLTKD